QSLYAPQGEGGALLLSVPAYFRASAGSGIVWTGLGAAGMLLLRGRFRALALIGGAALLLGVVVANSRLWVLPLSLVLYPERAVYWVTPLTAVALALAWQSLAPGFRRSALVRAVVLSLLVCFGSAAHLRHFQRPATLPAITRAEWDALGWAHNNLDPC